ncbi:MAG: MFS transporter [Sphingomonadales bacterium]|nr:MFS transporter [Sphingomonadales bacterium]
MTGTDAGFAPGWRQVWAGLAFLTVTTMIATSYSVIAVPLGEQFHPTRMVLMMAMTVMAAMSALLAPLLGWLMDRRSLRTMLGIGSALIALGYLALGHVASFAQVLVVFAVLIAPANVLIGPVAITVLLSRWFVRQRGKALGIAISGIGLGGFVFPPLIQQLLNHFGWRGAMQALALILVVVLAPAVLAVIDHPRERGLHADGADADVAAAQARAEGPELPWRGILSDPSFWLLALVVSIVTAGMKGTVTNLMPIALDQHVGKDAASLLISVYSGSAFIGKLGFAWLADRFDPRRLLIASLSGFALGCAIMLKADAGYVAIALGVGVIGLLGGLMVPLQSLLTPRIFGARVAGRAGGALSMVTLVALLSTPPLFGAIFDHTGSYFAIFVVFAGLAVAAALLVAPRMRLHPRDLPSD